MEQKKRRVVDWVFLSVFLFTFFTYYFFNIQSNFLTGNAVIETKNESLFVKPKIELTGLNEMLQTISFVFIFLFALVIFSKILHKKIDKKDKPHKVYHPLKFK